MNQEVIQHHKDMAEKYGMEEKHIGAIRSMFFTQGIESRQGQIAYLVHRRDTAKFSTKYKRMHRDEFPELRKRRKSSYNRSIARRERISEEQFLEICKKII